MNGSLLIRNGRVIDPASGFDQQADLAIADGKIVAIGPDLAPSGADIIDAAGMLVVPGLVDLHTHAYWGGALLGVNADKIGPRTGVTTWVDCGTSGAATFEGFYHHVIRRSRVRLLPFINLSYIGLTAAGNLSVDVGELFDWRFADLRELKRVGSAFASEIVGVKLRASNNATGTNSALVLPLAREAADMLGVPLMVHVGTAPPTIDEVLPFLREGDILTHIYNQSVGGCVLDAAGKLKASVRDAMARGVKMDVGHGAGSFSFRVAEMAMDQGLLPDAISTDLHAHNVDGPVFDLPTVMAKFITLGMDMREVLRRVTLAPASIVGRNDLGRLRVGSEADVAVFKLRSEPRDLVDSVGEIRSATLGFDNVATICRGIILETVDDGRSEGRDYR
ncbi:MAG TPA: amidohydrolase/deacetylase family metallohydrolase [Kaistia sp.]|nr:amidohydrolase/deacetylase family metallohydrolase [Kaistia sp.]